MKIAITNAVLPSEEFSGVPNQVHQLGNALVARGHDVTVFSLSPRPIDATYTLHQFVRPRIPARYFSFVMAYCLARTDFSSFDVLNVHGDNWLMRTSCPVVRTFHGAAVDEMRNAKTLRRKLFFLITIPLEWIGARKADVVVGVSEGTRASIKSVQSVIPCGVDIDAFSAGSKSDVPTILFVGTEEGRKRGAWLAELFKGHVLPYVPEAVLRMVSEREAAEPGIERYGRVSNERLAELYQSSWAFCLPSTYEGFGVPYIEAMAAHTAVVATSPNPGAREVLSNGQFGAFVSDDELGVTLRRILTDAGIRADMERRGVARSRDFAWPSVAEKYETAYSQAIEDKLA